MCKVRINPEIHIDGSLDLPLGRLCYTGRVGFQLNCAVNLMGIGNKICPVAAVFSATRPSEINNQLGVSGVFFAVVRELAADFQIPDLNLIRSASI